jgi:hypothetical protein
MVAVIGGVLLAVVLMLNRSGTPQPANSNSATASATTPSPSDNPFINAANNVVSSNTQFESMSRSEAGLQITLRLLFAVILSGVLAFRPRKDVPLFRRSLFVSQTQILLAVVAAALMMLSAIARLVRLRFLRRHHSSGSGRTFAIRKKSRFC